MAVVLRLVVAACLAWCLGVTAYLSSYAVPILANQELQANLVLTVAVVPAVLVGASFFYARGATTHGLLVGAAMFAIAGGCLDASITVPVFIVPAGGSYASFYSDPGFWLIGLEFVGVAFLYYRLVVVKAEEQTSLGGPKGPRAVALSYDAVSTTNVERK